MPKNIFPYVESFNLQSLFTEELGWEAFTNRLELEVDGAAYTFKGIAEKRGVQIFNLSLPTVPDYATRRKLEKAVADYALEHLIVFTDIAQTTQTWQWVARTPGKPAAYREHTYHKGGSASLLVQKLEGITFTIDEEEGLTLTGVTTKLHDEFNKEPVTKKFYERFKKEHAVFLDFISGIAAQGDREWYASVMLNRLMFVYFIQQNGFLAGDKNYLQNRLERVRRESGKDKFHSFYRHFLLKLFHEGFGSRARNPELEKLLGKIPYLNGGLFDEHRLERTHTDIHIPDEAFERIFDFFDDFNWHLDERPMREQNEINPDVLGYIFEKYINQKQMGAYYTKEDITGYISKNTIIPFVLESAQKGCKIAFEGEASVWRLLQNDPDRYIYDAVRKGAGLALPLEIAAGLDDVSLRGPWNTPAHEDYALPTEIWRETVARRQRYEEVKSKLQNGEVRNAGDLITYNLDIEQFMQDVIENAEGPELLRAIWVTVNGRVPKPGTNHSYRPALSVLDPTCGSGAFLFAALNILKPIYEACLTRMESFVADLEWSAKPQPERFGDFRDTLAQVAAHPNRDYFVLKSIVLNNLYGVDIMEEAVEIAKLRLFLKLAAQLEADPGAKNLGIEPLPDIDFNIRAGNTLVGYATYDEVKSAITGKLDFDDAMGKVEQKASDVDRLFRLFRQQQVIAEDIDAADLTRTKKQLLERLEALEEELNLYLAKDYGIDVSNAKKFKEWKDKHQPFHWFTEFYGIMKSGGFDAIVGNPPYVEYSKVKSQYQIKGYRTEKSGNLYAFIIERSVALQNLNGMFGLIVPISVICTDRTSPLQALIKKSGSSWYANFDTIPGRLFGKEVEQRLSVVINQKGSDKSVRTTFYQRFVPSQRDNLFKLLGFSDVSTYWMPGWIPRVSPNQAATILTKLDSKRLSSYQDANQNTPIYIHRIVGYYTKAFNFIPHFRNERDGLKKSEDYKDFLVSEKWRKPSLCLANSGLFYWYWHSHTDGFHCGYRDVWMFPINFTRMQTSILHELNELADALMDDLQGNSEIKVRVFKATGRAELQEFDVSKSKHIINQIDRVFAQHYNFSDDELDFIIHYDIKFRMGSNLLKDT